MFIFLAKITCCLAVCFLIATIVCSKQAFTVMIRKAFYPVIFFFTGVYGQQGIETSYLKKSRHVEVDMVGDILKVTQTDQFDKSFNQNFEKHTYHSVYYSDFDPVISLEAETQTSIKGKMKRTKVSAIETKDVVSPGIFYGGHKRKEFVFPGVGQGSIGHLEVVHEIKDVHLLTPFYFTEYINVENAEFSISFPKNVNVQYRLFGLDKEKLAFKKAEDGNKILYHWTLTKVPAYQFDKNSPGRSYSAPHIAVFIDSYELKGKKTSILSGVPELYNWYSSLIKRMPSGGDYTELDAKVNELTQGKTESRDKVRAIFQWVQQNVKYIAFEDGMAGFIPRAANDVYTKRFGDCKDMANILYYMLSKCGVQAHLTWIGTRDRPYKYEELPTPIVDNHMICAVQEGGEFYYLDATNPFLDFGKPSSMIQGKEALIGINASDFKVAVVPTADRKTNQRIDSVTLKLEKAGLRGFFSGHLIGYRKDDWQAARLRAAVRDDREFVRDFFKLGDNNIAIERKEERNNNGNVRFNFFQPGYYSLAGDRLFINLNFSRSLETDEVEMDRKSLIENDYRYEDKMIVKFEIPEGYSVKTLPADAEKNWNDFGIKTHYRAEGNSIILERAIFCDYLYLEPLNFGKWNEFLRTVAAINNQVITLSKSN
jgi:hypothetical protein